MCTLVVALKCHRNFPLVVAANRDEDVGRPSKPPRLWIAKQRVLAPIDKVGGGTWIGITERGLFVALTNRDGVPTPNVPLSRGQAVLRALAASSADEARSNVLALRPYEMGGFHLIVVDRRLRAFVIVNDGESFATHVPTSGLHVITNNGINTQEAAPLVGAYDEARRLGPKPETLGKIIETRAVTRGNWRTLSSTLVRLPSSRSHWDLWHREGATGPFGPKQTLALSAPLALVA